MNTIQTFIFQIVDIAFLLLSTYEAYLKFHNVLISIVVLVFLFLAKTALIISYCKSNGIDIQRIDANDKDVLQEISNGTIVISVLIRFFAYMFLASF